MVRTRTQRIAWIVLTALLCAPALVLGVRALRTKPSTDSTHFVVDASNVSVFDHAGSVPSYHVRDFDLILKRNVFDSTVGSLLFANRHTEPSSNVATPPTTAETAAALAQPCPSQARITGAIDSGDGQIGLVYLSPGNGQRSIELRVGDPYEARSVLSISWSEPLGAFVTLGNDRGIPECVIAQFAPATTVDGGGVPIGPVVRPGQESPPR